MIDEKGMTAHVASVGADAGQSLNSTNSSITDVGSDFKENIRRYQELSRMYDPSYLHTFFMNDLYDQVFTSRQPLIDGLLYSGTYLLAGAPKVGKSFLVAQIAYHVSTGQLLWGYPVRRGGVLYLALEDDQQRLQGRMSRMFGVEGTDDLNFAIASCQIGAGLDTQLENYLREHPSTKLVIIDTLQKVRAVSGEGSSYASDHEVVGQLKRLADSKGLCFLLVHHTRKQPADDKFEMISGTTGLLGCADGAFLLHKEKRTDLTATMDIVGRDQPDQRLYLIRDEERLTWQLDHAEAEIWRAPPDPLLEKVAVLVTPDAPEWCGSPSELAVAIGTDVAANVLTRQLNVNAVRLRSDYRIEYGRRLRHEGRRIYLRRLPADDAAPT